MMPLPADQSRVRCDGGHRRAGSAGPGTGYVRFHRLAGLGRLTAVGLLLLFVVTPARAEFEMPEPAGESATDPAAGVPAPVVSSPLPAAGQTDAVEPAEAGDAFASTAPTDPMSVRERDLHALAATLAWLECEDCDGGELAEVRAGGAAVRHLLEFALANGPSPTRLQAMRARLRALYEASDTNDQRPGRTDGFAGLGAEAYVEHYLAAYRRRVSARAERALAVVAD